MVAAVFGAVLTGLLYWVLWGGGKDYIDARLTEAGRRRQDAKRAIRRAEAELVARSAPLRSIKDPREAAGILMLFAAKARGEPTPEQIEVIQTELRDVLGLEDDLPGRFAYMLHAADRAPTPEGAIQDLAPLLHDRLTPAERGELRLMLDRVCALHGGPTSAQDAFVERTMRAVTRIT